MLDELELQDFSNVNGDLEAIVRDLPQTFIFDRGIKNLLLKAKNQGQGTLNKIIKIMSKHLDYYNIGDLRKFVLEKDGDVKDPNTIAQEILDVPNYFLFPEEYGSKYLKKYQNGVWKERRDSCLDKTILDHCSVNGYFDFEAPSKQNSKLNMIKKFIRAARPCHLTDFDTNDLLINVENGILDLRDGKLKIIKHNPKLKLIRQIPVKYDPKANNPRVLKFFQEIFHKEDIELMIQFFGLCMTPIMKFQKGVLLYGEGLNGKDTIINLMTLFLGPDNTSSVDISEFYKNFEYSSTDNKLLNACTETGVGDDKHVLQIRQIKVHIGAAKLIKIRRLYMAPYNSLPTAKLIQAINDNFPILPEDANKGFFRKWDIVECPNNFDGKEDENLIDKLTTEECKSTLLNILLLGLQKLLKEGKFTDNCKALTQWEQVKDFWISRTNFVKQFIEKECIVGAYLDGHKDPNNPYWEDKDVFRMAYNKYRKGFGKPEIKSGDCTQAVKTCYTVRSKKINNRTRDVYTGFCLKESYEQRSMKDEINIDNLFDDDGTCPPEVAPA